MDFIQQLEPLLFYFFLKEYYQGLSLGLVVLFIGLLITDTFLHHRHTNYLSSLSS